MSTHRQKTKRTSKPRQAAGHAADNRIHDDIQNAHHTNKTKNDDFFSTIKEKIEEGSYALGDAIERMGERLQKKGYPKLGQTVKTFGNKVEHIAK